MMQSIERVRYQFHRYKTARQDYMAALASIPNAEFEPLTPDVALSAVYLRQTFHLGFFDSHYAATALKLDRTIISFDRAYDDVKGLKRIDPTTEGKDAESQDEVS